MEVDHPLNPPHAVAEALAQAPSGGQCVISDSYVSI